MTKVKKAASGSSRRSGLAAYEDEGLDLAVQFLGLLSVRIGTLTKEGVREAIDNLPPTTKLQVTVADFWLGLARKEAQDRRRDEPPINPFTIRDGKMFLAAKASIEQWEMAWRMIEASRPLAISRLPKVRRVGDHMRCHFTWFVHDAHVVGLAGQPPVACFTEALTRPEDLSVRHLTLVDALRMPWKDSQEQIFWTKRLHHGNREIEAELEGLALKADARASSARQ